MSEERTDETSKEVVEKAKNEVATVQAWGAAENIDMSDLKVPKILLMQGLSDLVTKGVAKMGEYRDNVEEKLIGSQDKEIEIIIFDFFKTWRIFHKLPGQKRPKYISTEAITVHNADMPWEEDIGNGVVMMRVKNYNFYGVLAVEEIALEIPYLISFARTSASAAQRINSFFEKLRKANRPSASVVVGIKSEVESNDDGTFAVSNVRIVRDSTAKEIEAAKYWYDSIKSGKTKVEVKEDDDIPF